MRRTRCSRLPLAVITFIMSSAAMHAATTLSATPPALSLPYTKGATAVSQRVSIAPATGTVGSVYFTVKTDLPTWLQVDKMSASCTVALPALLNFSPSPVAASNPAGTYAATVTIQVANQDTVTFVVTMIVTNPPSTIKADLAPSSTSWIPGTLLPESVLTVKSSGDPVFFTVSSPQPWILLTPSSGVAYSWGTPVIVDFAASQFANPLVGSSMTGTIVVKAGNLTPVSTNVSITIGSPSATIVSISPAQLPQVIPPNTTRTIAVQGTNFASGMTVKLGGAAGATTAITPGCAITGTTDQWCIQSTQQFFLRLSTTTLAGASANGDKLTLLLSNCTAGQAPCQRDIQILKTPIVYKVTDAASFAQPSTSPNLSVAPYEMVSIFGDNLGTPTCTPAPCAPVSFINNRLPNSLTDSLGNKLQVQFTDQAGGSLTQDTYGYLLLWTASQINLLVPSTLPPGNGGSELKVKVNVGQISSDPTALNVAQASPALLTFGNGQGVVVNADGTINSNTNPAKFGTTITLYLSGMGIPMDGTTQLTPQPPGTAVDRSTNVAPGDCADYFSFQTFLIGSVGGLHPTWQTFDGAVIDGSLLGSAWPPCFNPVLVTITIGTSSTTLDSSAIIYAGFTQDSIAGLYQVNVALPAITSLPSLLPVPATAPTATAYPIQLSIGGISSQSGVNVYLAK
jgi:uncharacterized protein (TIGR03437 family)